MPSSLRHSQLRNPRFSSEGNTTTLVSLDLRGETVSLFLLLCRPLRTSRALDFGEQAQVGIRCFADAFCFGIASPDKIQEESDRPGIRA
jgi:hypothetical protein